MQVRKAVSFDKTRDVVFDEPTVCPLCKRAIKPVSVHINGYRNNENLWFLSHTHLCNSCFNTFVAQYACDIACAPVSTTLMYVGPIKYTEQHFEEAVETLSPQFVKIFNQAAEAEATGLDEIAGLGYRKAVEFLTKDFCIHMHPEKEDEIKVKQLGSCISSYIESTEIKTLAARIAWLGNDEAHYIRKHTERDISDMKKFISALVHFIGMTLIVEDAASIPPA